MVGRDEGQERASRKALSGELSADEGQDAGDIALQAPSIAGTAKPYSHIGRHVALCKPRGRIAGFEQGDKGGAAADQFGLVFSKDGEVGHGDKDVRIG